MDYLYYRAVNWDETEDAKDQATWLKLTNNFWLDGRVPISGDRSSWNQLTFSQRDLIGQQLAGISMLTAFESEIGAPGLRDGHLTQQEEAVLNIITFMESVHTKAVTTIFRGLISQKEAAHYFQWADANQMLQKEVAELDAVYHHSNQLVRRAAFILTETMLINGKLAFIARYPQLKGVSQMLKNIMTGQAIFVDYLGYKFREALREQNEAERKLIMETIQALTYKLWLTENRFLKKHGTKDMIEAAQWGRNEAHRLLTGQDRLADAPVSDPFIRQLQSVQAQAQKAPVDSEIVDADAVEAMTSDDYDF